LAVNKKLPARRWAYAHLPGFPLTTVQGAPDEEFYALDGFYAISIEKYFNGVRQ